MQRVQCAVTGFVGVVTGFARYMDGTNNYLVQPAIDKDGKYVEGIWFGENRLIRLDDSEPRKES